MARSIEHTHTKDLKMLRAAACKDKSKSGSCLRLYECANNFTNATVTAAPKTSPMSAEKTTCVSSPEGMGATARMRVVLSHHKSHVAIQEEFCTWTAGFLHLHGWVVTEWELLKQPAAFLQYAIRTDIIAVAGADRTMGANT